MSAMWRLLSPRGIATPVAVFELRATDLDGLLSHAGVSCGIGRLALRDLGGIDRGVIARAEADVAYVMPHGGPAVVRAVAAWLDASGFARADEHTENRTIADQIAAAASPLAVDAIARGATEPGLVLERLVRPPAVVLVGSANIGKSTLVNALARRTVSIVSDTPGTTLDAVGVAVEFDGVVVRVIDTPGVRSGAGDLEREAVRRAGEALANADLVLACRDAGVDGAPVAPGDYPPGVPAIRVALRSDLTTDGSGSSDPNEHRVSAATGDGMESLARAIRDALFPPGDLERLLASPSPR